MPEDDTDEDSEKDEIPLLFDEEDILPSLADEEQGEIDSEEKPELDYELREYAHQQDVSPAESQMQIDVKEAVEIDPTGNPTVTVFGETYLFASKTRIQELTTAGRRTAMYMGITTLTGGVSATTLLTAWTTGQGATTSAVLITTGVFTGLLTVFFGVLFWTNWTTVDTRVKEIGEAQ